MSDSVKDKQLNNIWDSIDDVLPIIEAARKKDGTWTWAMNTKCKYIKLQIDMRDGGCIIMNRDGERINPEDLAYQYGKEKTTTEE